MDYIIDPMWFYWLQIVDSIQGLFCIVAIASGVISLILLAFYVASVFEGCEYEEDSRKQLKGIIKPLVICFIIAITATVLPHLRRPSLRWKSQNTQHTQMLSP